MFSWFCVCAVYMLFLCSTVSKKQEKARVFVSIATVGNIFIHQVFYLFSFVIFFITIANNRMKLGTDNLISFCGLILSSTWSYASINRQITCVTCCVVILGVGCLVSLFSSANSFVLPTITKHLVSYFCVSFHGYNVNFLIE